MKNLTHFFINGQKYSTNIRLTLTELLEYLNYKNLFFVVEHNKQICRKQEWNQIYVQNKDKIEIITIAGGG